MGEGFAKLKERIKFIDIYKIFSNRGVQGLLQAAYDTDYRGYGLDEVSAAYLQNGEEKLDGLSGKNVELGKQLWTEIVQKLMLGDMFRN